MQISKGKLLTIFILFAFLFNTLSPALVWAQEQTSTKSEGVHNTVQASSSKDLEASSTEKPVSSKETTTPQAVENSTSKAEAKTTETELATQTTATTEAPGPGEIKSPDSPLNSNAAYQTGLFTGSANYEYNIPVPPGTNALTPDVKLSYNSMGVSGKEGILGVGWSLNLSYIYRDPNFSVADTSNDIFKLILNGASYDLVYDSASQLYKTKVDSALWIKYYTSGGNNQLGSYWIVRSKEGTEYKFGISNDSESVCLNRNYTTRWHLKSIVDTSGNGIYYDYIENLNTNDLGTTYLSKVSYNTDKSRTIEFIYQDKQYSILNYELGCTTRESKYLTEINIKVNSSVTKKYKLEYYLNNPRPLLTSIQENDANGITLPKTLFEYFLDKTGSYELNSSFSNVGKGIYFSDFDRDGLPERFVNTNKSRYQENNGKTILSSIIDLGYTGLNYITFQDNDYQFLDFNSDGFVDYIYSYYYSKHPGDKRDWAFYSGNGQGSFTQTYSIPKSQGIPASSYKNIRLTDLNADGGIDIVYGSKVYINTGSTWTLKPEWTIPSFTPYGNIDPSHYLQDINMDGFVDFVDSTAYTTVDGKDYVISFLNNGSQFVSPSMYFNEKGQRFIQPGDALIDINNDGLVDILQSYDNSNGNERMPWIVIKNNGKGGWLPAETWIPSTTDSLARSTQLSDINGDGLVDMVAYVYGRVYINTSEPRINLLKKITTPLGGTTEIDYTPSTRYDNTGGDGISDLGFPVWTVSKITENDGLSNINQTSYIYKNGAYDYADREFRGFGQVTTTNSEGSITEHYFYQDDALKGNEYKTIVKDTAGKLYQETRNTWTSVLANGVYTNRLITADNFTYDAVAKNPKQTRVSYQYDVYGNMTQEKNLGDNSVSGDELTTNTTYVYNTNAWILNKPKNVQVVKGASTKVKEAWFYYDSSTDNNAIPTKGLLTQEEYWNNTGKSVIQKYEYNTFGNVIKNTDPLNRNTLFEYDATNTFQTRITNAKNQVVNITYNPATGNKLSEKDPNGYIKTYVYDGFGRITKEIMPYDNTTYPTVQYQYSVTGSAPSALKVMKREKAGKADTIDAITFVDGFGRVIQTRAEAENNTKHIVTSFVYNGFGKVKKQIVPYLEAASQTYKVPSASLKSTKIDFDPVGRVIKVTAPDNTTQGFKYDHWKLTLTDANNHTKIQYLNAYNQIVQIDEYLGSKIFTTRYEYQFPGGNITKLTDSKGSVIRFEYDSLGRNTKLIDHSLGTWKYSYDAAGNMIKQIDNRLVSISTTYDALNRPLTINYPTDKDIQFIYDREKKGTLSQITDATGISKYTYDNRLRIIKEEKNISLVAGADGSPAIDKTFVVETTYDSADRVTALKYPALNGQAQGETVNYLFNNQGQIESMSGLITNINYNQLNKITRKTFANGVNTNYTYNTTTERLTEISSTNATNTPLQRFKYTYDNIGNLSTIEDVIKATTQRFTYDDLDRLITAVETGNTGYNLKYEYDSVGNILSVASNEGVVEYYYEDTSRPNILTRVIPVTGSGQECAYFTAKYYTNETVSGVPVYKTCEKNIDYDWGWGEINPYVGSDNASVSWQGFFEFDAEEYTFQLTVDDGVRLYIDNALVVDEWKMQGARNFTYKKPMRAGEHEIKIEYFEDGGPAIMRAFWEKSKELEPVTSNPSVFCPGIANNTFCAAYYPNVYLGGTPDLARKEKSINYTWNNEAPAGYTKNDNYAVSWSGNFELEKNTYTFSATADDGVRLWVDGKILINEWKNQTSTTYSQSIDLEAGVHNIVMEYYEFNNTATAKLKWVSANKSPNPNNIALNKPVQTSTTYSLGAYAVDGKYNTSWNAGAQPEQWLAIDLGDAYIINQIKLFVDQSPAGNTYHQLQASMDCGTYQTIEVFNGYTQVGDALIFTGPVSARCIKVNSLSSPSSVAWQEIEVYSEGLATGTQLSAAQISANFNNLKTNKVDQTKTASGSEMMTGNLESNYQTGSGSAAQPDTLPTVKASKPAASVSSAPTPVPSLVSKPTSGTSEQTKKLISDKVTLLKDLQTEAKSVSQPAGVATQKLSAAQALGSCTNFTAQYFNNETLSGTPAVEVCSDWPEGVWGSGSPAPLIQPNNFSARWSGNMYFEAGKYSFWSHFDDGIKLWIDNQLVLNYWNTPSSIPQGKMIELAAGNHAIKLEYVEKSGDAFVHFWWDRVLNPCTNLQTGEFCASYFNTPNLTGNIVSEMKESTINKAWTGSGGPAVIYNVDNFSIRWTGKYAFTADTYSFNMYADDGVKLWIDNELVLNKWDGFAGEQSVEKLMSAGIHEIKLEFKEVYGDAIIVFNWQKQFRPIINYTYDANGNVISDNIYCYEYNEGNKLRLVKKCSDNSLVSEYIYDSKGQRVVKKTYVNGIFDKVSIEVSDLYDYTQKANGEIEETKYYRANSELIAKRNVILSQSKDKLTYHHNDHLGSASIVTDTSGNILEETRYYPYGEVREGGTQQKTGKYTYTGQESDEETGLMYYGARYYSAEVSRFVQPDTMLPDMYDPQQLNRYVYVRNNPLKYVDPSGHFAFIPLAIGIGIVALKAIDYGWTAWDVFQAGRTLADPNASRGDRVIAGASIALAGGLEAIEPDDYTPVNLPIDDVARKGLLKGMKQAYKSGGDRALEKYIKKYTGVDVGVHSSGNLVKVNYSGIKKPTAADGGLQGLIDQLYKPGAEYGGGGTADALRYEMATDKLLSPKGHKQKADERITNLNNWIKNNPNASKKDINTAKTLINDLTRALDGK